MYLRLKDLRMAIILGIICPALLFWFVEDKNKEPLPSVTVPVTEPEIVTTALPEVLYLPVLMDDGIIEQMELDTYLTSVVLCEMPADFESEALKAQAVVARTYALRRLEGNGKHTGAAICTDASCCQGYRSQEEYLSNGGRQELLDKVIAAVRETTNEVLVYDGELIEATYFSCSGGTTEDAQAVWGSFIPYLQSTESPGEERATHYTDTVVFKTEEFQRLLGSELSSEPENWIEGITYTEGGGVDTIQICGVLYKGTTLRQKLGLRSTSFVITVLGNTVTITTKGFGHRVGMSQYGADAMALQGSTYPEILSHYYQGAELVDYSG